MTDLLAQEAIILHKSNSNTRERMFIEFPHKPYFIVCTPSGWTSLKFVAFPYYHVFNRKGRRDDSKWNFFVILPPSHLFWTFIDKNVIIFVTESAWHATDETLRYVIPGNFTTLIQLKINVGRVKRVSTGHQVYHYTGKERCHKQIIIVWSGRQKS